MLFTGTLLFASPSFRGGTAGESPTDTRPIRVSGVGTGNLRTMHRVRRIWGLLLPWDRSAAETGGRPRFVKSRAGWC